MQRRRRLAAQEVEEMGGDRVVVGLGVDPPAVVRPVIPVEQHRGEAGDQAVGNLARRPGIVVLCFGQDGSQRRTAAAQDIHRMRRGGQILEHRPQHHRQSAQGLQFLAVLIELRRTGQAPVKQKVGDLLETRILGERDDVVATVVQVVAAAPDRADGGIAGDHARQGDRFLGPGELPFQNLVHDLPFSSSRSAPEIPCSMHEYSRVWQTRSTAGARWARHQSPR
jgi:hypothetical protein